MAPSVAIVILNWNGQKLLAQFLPSIVKTNYPNLQIILGDNASTDNSVDFVKANFPQIKIISNDKNYGFAGGYNEILKRVDADYFVLLNSDVEVPENWVQPVVDLMQSDDQIAVAQPKIKWQKRKTKFEYAGAAGGFLDTFAYPFCRGRIFDDVETDENQYNQSTEIFWASGAAFFIKKKNWEEVGGLDADLFAHMEEIDICWRLKNLGYKIMYCADAAIYHLGGGTLNAVNPHKTYLNFRNNLIIMQKNLPSGEAFYRIFIRFWLDFIAFLQFLLKGKFKFAMAISKAHIHFLKYLSVTAKKRTQQQIALVNHSGVYAKSIVWAYFAQKIKKFSELVF